MHSSAPSPLGQALQARKIAIFGASATPGKMGYVVAKELIEHGFAGDLALVNPKGGTVFGRQLVTASLAAGAEVAVIATPAQMAPDIVSECGELGIPLVVVQSAGFSEVGNVALEETLRARGRERGVRIVGPNCLGILVSNPPANLTSLPQMPAGNVSFISQSGGLAFQVSRRLRALGSGFDVLLSLGNKIDVGFTEALQVVGFRRTTASVLLYMERLDEGEEFLEQMAIATKHLPVIAVVGGQTDAGQVAAASHTGSLLSRWDRVAGVLADAGASVFDNLELATTVAARSRRGERTRIENVFVLCDGGGHSVLLADALTRAGFHLPVPAGHVAQDLELIVGPKLANRNPLDFAGLADADPAIYGPTLEAALKSGQYDAAVVGGFFGGYAQIFGNQLGQAENDGAAQIAQLITAYGRPIVVQTAFADANPPALAKMRATGVPIVEWPHEAAAILRSRSSAQLAQRTPALAKPHSDANLAQLTDKTVEAFDRAGIRHGIGARVREGDLPVDSNGLWVLRLDGFAHKNRVGAIKLPLAGKELVAAFRDLAALARSNGLDPMIRLAPFTPHDHELIVTFWRNQQEGAGWLIGAGGEAVEREADTAVGRTPQSYDDVVRAMLQTRVGRHLLSLETTRIDELARIILALGNVFSSELRDLTELECNPVGVGRDGAIVLDALPHGSG